VQAVERARRGDGPTLLECQTYRHYGHSKGDPAPYRPKEEVEQWLERDPLKLARARLVDGGLSEAELTAVEESVKALMDQAVQSALAAPYPDPQTDAATEFRS
jgi:pyruvate dehydrogenase E1 component alpha subunit